MRPKCLFAASQGEESQAEANAATIKRFLQACQQYDIAESVNVGPAARPGLQGTSSRSGVAHRGWSFLIPTKLENNADIFSRSSALLGRTAQVFKVSGLWIQLDAYLLTHICTEVYEERRVRFLCSAFARRAWLLSQRDIDVNSCRCMCDAANSMHSVCEWSFLSKTACIAFVSARCEHTASKQHA